MSFMPNASQNSQGTSAILADVVSLLQAVEGQIGNSGNTGDSDDTGGVQPDTGSQTAYNGQPSNAIQSPSFGSGSDAFASPQPQGQSEMNALGLILQGLGELLAGLSSSQGGGNGGSGGAQGPGSRDPMFNNFQASDTGDPHLSFNGTMQNGSPFGSGGGLQPLGQGGSPFGNGGGAQPFGGPAGAGLPFGSQPGSATSSPTNISGKWDDMQGESDLLHADINGGRYQVSTDVTPPIDDNGTRLNKSVQVGFGADSVKVDGAGSVTLSGPGGQTTLAAGQTVTDPNNGFKVTRSADGNTVTATMQGPDGKDVSTTMQIHAEGYKGQQYVDITNMSGDHVRLGGAMVDYVAGTDAQGAAPGNVFGGGGVALSQPQPYGDDGNRAVQNAVNQFMTQMNQEQIAQLQQPQNAQPQYQADGDGLSLNLERLSFSEE